MSFLLRHQPSGRLIAFDLGIRKDYERYPSCVVGRIKEVFTIKVDQDVRESLVKGGVDPASVGHVIFSHLHWDHVGDNSPFTNATFVLGGDGQSLLSPGFPGDPESRYTTETAPEGRTQ
jgi:glyoxylase-like metal-dependent hydrolase (beta-lactamase superfamily II)